MNPKVSVIIPVYNVEKYLKRCLDSVKNQTLEEIEIILIDDGSSDSSPEICDEAADADARIRVIHKVNEGAGIARNAGLEVATGQYIGFVDSDDYIDYRMYENLYEAAIKHDADLVVSGVCFVGGNIFDEKGEYTTKTYFNAETVLENDDIKNLTLGIFGALPREPDDSRYGTSVWKNLFKREIIKKNNLRFLSEKKVWSEDTLFMIDYLQFTKKAVGDSGAWYYYCRNGASLSKFYSSERFEKCMAFFQEVEKRVQKNIAKEEYKIYLDRLMQGFSRVLCSREIMYAREHKVPFSVLKGRLKRICTQKEIADVLKGYPWYKLPLKQAAFAFAMKYRLYRLQRLLVILRAG